MARIVVDPVTRIEGHLRIEAQVEGGSVTDAWSSGTMFRGIELILRGRDPREAWIWTQRICGVCTTVHALTSVRAVEDALGIEVPPNAELIRNIIAATQYVQDHVIHFYHLHALDWVDVTLSLVAGAPISFAESLVRLGLLTAAQRESLEKKVREQQAGVQQLGPYKLVKKLGEGGMGAVYLAIDPAGQRQVALKVLPRHYGSNPEFVKRFKREAEAAAQLKHPNIIGAFAAGEDLPRSASPSSRGSRL